MSNKPMICVPIVSNDPAAIKKAAPLADLFEVRIDLIGKGWRDVAGRLSRPWLACNRRAEEGGKWRGSEPARIAELLGAIELGAGIIDIELTAPGLNDAVKVIKNEAECLISYHDVESTPTLEQMREIVQKQLSLGADICKVVTTAHTMTDNLAVLQLIREFSKQKIVAFAMGMAGQISRVLCPLVGGYLTYASITAGKESAIGQIQVEELRKLYGMI